MQRNKQFTLKDLASYVYLNDWVIIYRKAVETDEVFESHFDMYKGRLQDVPEDILSLPVITIGANSDGILDIYVKHAGVIIQ